MYNRLVSSPRALLGSLFVISTCILGVEVAEVRVFSYSLDPLLVFCAISVALLGLGAGAIAVALRPRLAEGDPRGILAGSAAAFAASSLLAHALFARASESIGFGTSSGVVAAALPIFALFAVPYFFAGLFVAVAMSRAGGETGKVYAVNLAGSALGGVVLHPLLRPFGVEPVLAAFSALAALAALALAPTRFFRRGAAAVALASCAAVPFAPAIFPFQPDPGDLYGVARAALAKASPGAAVEPRREFSRWDPVARIEVYAFPGAFGLVNDAAPVRFFAQDGGAGSMLVDLRGHDDVARLLFDATVYGGAYALHPAPERALVIGVGGAPDVLAALHHGAKHVTGVEINATTIDVVGGPYAALLGDPYGDPRVAAVHHDGRSFVERSSERWDVIQMTGADTYAAGAAGAFMFSESYLYTVEAFQRYWAALSDDGVLGVIRFGLEPYRVLATAIAAMRALGVEHPERHIVVLTQGIWVNVLVSRAEIAPAALARVGRMVAGTARGERLRIPVYDALGFGLAKPIELYAAPGAKLPNPYAELVDAATRGEERQVLARAALDFTPVVDDRPFFFQFLGLRHLGRVFTAAPNDYYARGLRAHLVFLLTALVASALLLLLPVAVARREEPAAPLARPLAFVAAIGLAYLFVEMTVMQKGALLLGHPTYSVSVTLVALLCGSGLGSFWSGRRDPARAARFGALAVALLLGLALAGLEPLFAVALPWPLAARVAVLAGAMLPLGFAMGLPFPSALRALGGGRAVAWALATNSLTSVLASLVAVPLAMFLGFRAVLVLAALCYLAAAALAPRPP